MGRRETQSEDDEKLCDTTNDLLEIRALALAMAILTHGTPLDGPSRSKIVCLFVRE
jgi:hypothetical protein